MTKKNRSLSTSFSEIPLEMTGEKIGRDIAEKKMNKN